MGVQVRGNCGQDSDERRERARACAMSCARPPLSAPRRSHGRSARSRTGADAPSDRAKSSRRPSCVSASRPGTLAQRRVHGIERGIRTVELVLHDDVARVRATSSERGRPSSSISCSMSGTNRRVAPEMHLGKNHAAVSFAADRGAGVAHGERDVDLPDLGKMELGTPISAATSGHHLAGGQVGHHRPRAMPQHRAGGKARACSPPRASPSSSTSARRSTSGSVAKPMCAPSRAPAPQFAEVLGHRLRRTMEASVGVHVDGVHLDTPVREQLRHDHAPGAVAAVERDAEPPGANPLDVEPRERQHLRRRAGEWLRRRFDVSELDPTSRAESGRRAGHASRAPSAAERNSPDSRR
jgi:hypothetical protein